MNKGGLGIRDLETRAASEYIGGAVSGISQLLDRRDKDGLMIRGRMTSERLIDWLGSTSFDTETADPWAILMEKDSMIAGAIKQAWTEISVDHKKNAR